MTSNNASYRTEFAVLQAMYSRGVVTLEAITYFAETVNGLKRCRTSCYYALCQLEAGGLVSRIKATAAEKRAGMQDIWLLVENGRSEYVYRAMQYGYYLD